MSKLRTNKIFLKDQAGNYYRICSVANPKDYTGEYYLKIMFPDIKDIPLITGEHDEKGVVGKIGRLPKGLQEFSYHYRSGVSHFKDSSGRVDRETNKPTLFSFPALHLVRFIVRSLALFGVKNGSEITGGDLVLPGVFDGRPRGFEFVISRLLGWSVTNEQGKEPIYSYKIILEDPNVSFYIADGIWNRPPIARGDTLFEIFRYTNPTENFSEVKARN